MSRSRSLKAGGVEVKPRHEAERAVVAQDELMDWLADWWAG